MRGRAARHSRRRDHQRAAQAEPRRFVGDARDRAGLRTRRAGMDVVNERQRACTLDASGFRSIGIETAY